MLELIINSQKIREEFDSLMPGSIKDSIGASYESLMNLELENLANYVSNENKVLDSALDYHNDLMSALEIANNYLEAEKKTFGEVNVFGNELKKKIVWINNINKSYDKIVYSLSIDLFNAFKEEIDFDRRELLAESYKKIVNDIEQKNYSANWSVFKKKRMKIIFNFLEERKEFHSIEDNKIEHYFEEQNKIISMHKKRLSKLKKSLVVNDLEYVITQARSDKKHKLEDRYKDKRKFLDEAQEELKQQAKDILLSEKYELINYKLSIPEYQDSLKNYVDELVDKSEELELLIKKNDLLKVNDRLSSYKVKIDELLIESKELLSYDAKLNGLVAKINYFNQEKEINITKDQAREIADLQKVFEMPEINHPELKNIYETKLLEVKSSYNNLITGFVNKLDSLMSEKKSSFLIPIYDAISHVVDVTHQISELSSIPIQKKYIGRREYSIIGAVNLLSLPENIDYLPLIDIIKDVASWDEKYVHVKDFVLKSEINSDNDKTYLSNINDILKKGLLTSYVGKDLTKEEGMRTINIIYSFIQES